MKDESLENNVVTLRSRGWSIRRLSRELGLSRRRITRILGEHFHQREQGVEKLPPIKRGHSKLDVWKPYIGELLAEYTRPPITNQRVLELLRQKGYEGGQTILRDYLVEARGKKSPEAIYVVETPPGGRASHDWSDYYLNFERSGAQKVTFFSYILNYSRRQYIELVDNKSQQVLIRAMMNAFVYLDGVPRQIKSDNQRACVDRWERGRPVFNKTYLGFATHYCFEPLAIHPGKPRENLKVERPFYYLEKSFLNGRQFHDPDDLREQLIVWLTQVNDQRVHRTTGRKPIEMYAEELPYLQPLPRSPYDASVIDYRVVNGESAIQWEGYYYMVPGGYLYETCPVRVEEKQLTIYSPSCTPLITHPLAQKGQKERYVGRTSPQGRKRGLTTGELTERLEAFGAPMVEYATALKEHNPSSWRHHWVHLVALKAFYAPADILRAVSRASKYHVYDASAIENFLKTNTTGQAENRFTTENPYRDDTCQ